MMNRCKAAMTRQWMPGCFIGMALLVSFGQVDAQSQRDPTMPPAELGIAGTAAPGEKLLSVEPGAMTIIVRNGRPHVVVGTRLYAQGQMLGQSRIERISETEVWLREGKVLRKVSQFSGIERRTVPLKTLSPVTPLVGTLPQGLSQ